MALRTRQFGPKWELTGVKTREWARKAKGGPASDPGRRLTHPAGVAEGVAPEVTGSQGQVTPHRDLPGSG